MAGSMLLGNRFVKFILTPSGPSVIIQIGIYLCLFFFFSQIRNVFQQYSSYENCTVDQNTFDLLSVVTSGIIAFISIIALSVLFKQLSVQYKQFKIETAL